MSDKYEKAYERLRDIAWGDFDEFIRENKDVREQYEGFNEEDKENVLHVFITGFIRGAQWEKQTTLRKMQVKSSEFH